MQKRVPGFPVQGENRKAACTAMVRTNASCAIVSRFYYNKGLQRAERFVFLSSMFRLFPQGIAITMI
jgi:hypothetical protein